MYISIPDNICIMPVDRCKNVQVDQLIVDSWDLPQTLAHSQRYALAFWSIHQRKQPWSSVLTWGSDVMLVSLSSYTDPFDMLQLCPCCPARPSLATSWPPLGSQLSVTLGEGTRGETGTARGGCQRRSKRGLAYVKQKKLCCKWLVCHWDKPKFIYFCHKLAKGLLACHCRLVTCVSVCISV